MRCNVKKFLFAVVPVLILVVIALMSIASAASAQPAWIPCPIPRTEEEGVYMWGNFPEEESCVYATQSIPDLHKVPRLKDGIDFLCEARPDEWLVVFYSGVDLHGNKVEYSSCGWTKLPWQPKSVQIERIEHIPPEVVFGPQLIFFPFLQN
jgi:hypothetical protein